MKKIVLLPIVAILAALIAGCVGAGDGNRDSNSGIVTFPDSNLEAAIQTAISKPEGAIHVADLERLDVLEALTRDITDITGLEYCIQLTSLYLVGNQISDITPLSNLTSLTELGLADNQIADISPLSNLTSLTELSLQRNQISDIAPLSNLTGLTKLWLYDNQITEITSLENLTSLRILYLYNNQISDITPLTNLTSLTYLDLQDNEIHDITPLVGNEGLSGRKTVDLRGNPLSTESYDIQIPQLEARGVKVLW
jgi:Leucine-rich repeat (LRR) protein